MKNSNQTDEVVGLLRVSLKKYIDSGLLKMEDNALSFHASDEISIKKLILDDGYEDPIEVSFTPQALTLQVPVDAFGIGNARISSAQIVEDLGSFISSLLDSAYRLEKISLFNATIYQIKTDSKSYRAFAKETSLIPAFIVEAFGKRTVLK